MGFDVCLWWHAVLALAGIGFGLWRMCMEEQIDPPEHSCELPPAVAARLSQCPSGTSKAASWLHSTHDSSMHARSHEISSRDTQHSTPAHSISQRTRYSPRSPSPTTQAAVAAAVAATGQSDVAPQDAVIGFQRAQHSPHARDQGTQNYQHAQAGITAMKLLQTSRSRPLQKPSKNELDAEEAEITFGCGSTLHAVVLTCCKLRAPPGSSLSRTETAEACT